MIEPSTGRWLNADDAEDAAAAAEEDPARGKPQRIVPMVEDHKNALLLQPLPSHWTILSPQRWSCNMHSCAASRLNSSSKKASLLSEPMPSRTDRRAILLYEATEGGAGVLARVARERDALARVAQQALRSCTTSGLATARLATR